ncbi:arginine--tRNA ligase [Glycomyces xiaoerkulensis]|uniref:arginine--tRNA ligase n=1 Tax=Glycomyces xiaoerkulensis TaxID=2038139 RepID=UPI000C25F33B|nr:arginine--tRNA ligase [Glycomyces xiaoerkulensis]
MNAQSVTPLVEAVETAVADAIRRVLPETGGTEPLVRRSDFADYQSNAALPVAKESGRNPREIGGAVAEALDGAGVIAGAEVSGPGFVNLDLTDTAIWDQIASRGAAEGLGVGSPLAGKTIVVDYSGPNIAKEMHVGHLRTTIIGDALARLAEAQGATVIRQNHLGDWGTQFGMLIQYLTEHPEAEWHEVDDADPTANIAALDRLYKEARAAFDADEDFADRARSRVVALQTGDETSAAVWSDLVKVSTDAFDAIYERLGVSLTEDDNAGESTYNDQLNDVVDELVTAGIAVESEGALCVFFDDITGPDGEPVPMILRKADGGFGYAATDLAALRHRVRDLKADQILYVVDARQALHFKQLFAAARRAGWLTGDVEAAHVPFGTVLGPDGKPFKTRSGSTVRLMSLLDDAVEKAGKVIGEKNAGADRADLAELAAVTGIGAVKYADLSNSRIKDYAFDTDKMVALTGDTGVYLQYAHTRLASILRKSGDVAVEVDDSLPMSNEERALALHLDAYGAALAETMAEFEPHRLCVYLYRLARTFTGFYEANPVLNAETASARGNRLSLVRLTQGTLAHGLGLLGIEAPERM